MPIFRSINVLLIHIPKTGGSSIEDYFIGNFQKKCTISNLLVRSDHLVIDGHSPQHSTYQELYDDREFLDLNFDKLTIITAVRRPYDRIISDMFFYHLLNKNDTSDVVCEKMKEFLKSPKSYDNHKKKQIDFLLYNGSIPDSIKILRTETLTEDMKSIGYDDFDVEVNVTHKKTLDYMAYFNRESLDLINEIYHDDFIQFGYEMI